MAHIYMLRYRAEYKYQNIFCNITISVLLKKSVVHQIQKCEAKSLVS